MARAFLRPGSDLLRAQQGTLGIEEREAKVGCDTVGVQPRKKRRRAATPGRHTRGRLRERFRELPYHVRQVYVTVSESRFAHLLETLVGEFPELLLGSYPGGAQPRLPRQADPGIQGSHLSGPGIRTLADVTAIRLHASHGIAWESIGTVRTFISLDNAPLRQEG